jgi:predicted CoA-binding protein
MSQCNVRFFADGVGGNSPVNQGRFANSAFDRLRILERYKRIGMVGLSSNPFRPSHFAAIYLISEGYDVIPVNPRESQVLGGRVTPHLLPSPGPVEVVNIFREPAAVPAIVEEATPSALKVIWMQLGVIHEEAAERRVQRTRSGDGSVQKIEHARFFGGLNTIGMNTALIRIAAAARSGGGITSASR